MPLPAHLPALILALAAVAHAAETTGTALASDGTVARGPVRAADGGVGVEGIARDRLVAVRLAGPVPGWIDQGLVLADGDVLRGTTLAVTGEGVTFAADLLGQIRVPLAEIAAIRLNPARAAEPVPADFAGAVLANGDRLAGRLASLDAAAVGIDTGKKTVSIPRARVALVAFAAAAPADARRLVVRFANGDRLGGTLAAPAAERWELTSRRGVVRFAAGDARGLWLEGADRLPLSRLTPTAGEVAGTDGGPDGRWLASGDQRWDRGLCCRAPARIEYAIPAGSAALVGEVALADGAGSAVFRVLVDGQPLFDSGAVAAGAPAKPFAVKLAGAATLALVVQPGPDCDTVGPRAVWGWATLVK